MKTPTLEKMLRTASDLTNPALLDFKEKGGRVMGYYCPFVPEELFIAGGFLPFRIRGTGSVETDRADAYFNTLNCCFVRHSFNQLLLGRYDFLDGLVIGTGCDHLRRIYDNAIHADVGRHFIYLLDHPRTMGAPVEGSAPIIEYYRSMLARLKEAIENHFCIAITVPALKNAIRLCNETRSLQKELYELSMFDSLPISAAERAAVIMAGASMPKDQYNEDLKALISELQAVPGDNKKPAARIMMIGAAVEDPEFYAIFENGGADIVIDDTCFGARTVQKSVDENADDPLMALARYQVIDMPFCPKIGGAHVSRMEFIKEMAAKYKVDGIVAQGYVPCDAWGCSFALLNQDLKKAGIPYLRIDRDYIHSQTGQLATRIQAFIETMGGGI